MLEFFKSDIYVWILSGIVLIMIVLYVTNSIKLSKLRKSYKEFMRRLGNGNNMDEMMMSYIKKVNEVDQKSEQLLEYCHKINENVGSCLQKIGFVRYNAFQDTGSDLSFAMAILDRNNNGIIINGIYSRDGSNVYSKIVEKGKSPYRLSAEEEQALEEALKK